jgi:hypothetical protein
MVFGGGWGVILGRFVQGGEGQRAEVAGAQQKLQKERGKEDTHTHITHHARPHLVAGGGVAVLVVHRLDVVGAGLHRRLEDRLLVGVVDDELRLVDGQSEEE